MALTEQEFDEGVNHWPSSWGTGFHNDFYRRLAGQNPHGEFTLAWWEEFSSDLVRWKALRPVSRAVVTERVQAAMEGLGERWATTCAPLAGNDITAVKWEEVSAFPELVATLKPNRSGAPTRSPVFRSKFCHFLAPEIFPVVDGAFMGRAGRSYESYFREVQSEWADTPGDRQQRLRHRMTELIGSEPVAGYPFVNKITELALGGRRALTKK